MLHFSRWKQAAILLTCLLGLIVVLPNFVSQTLNHWPGWLPKTKLTLGLDLQGGAHLLYKLEVDDVRKDWLETLRDDARQRLKEAKIAVDGVGIAGNAVQVRLPNAEDADAAFKALRQVAQPLGNPLLGASGVDVEVHRGEGGSFSIVPTSVVAGLLAIVAYVWFRFEWQFALGAIVALTHDVLLTAGVFSLLQLEFDLSIVAALLTILGYSVNDTVVVSDRIRENLRKYKRMPLDELLNLSINETLSRTILTGCTAIAVLIALYVLGGEVIRNFNFAMLFGVLVGTYSSIFIAAPLLGYLGVKREWGGGPAPKPAGAAQRPRWAKAA